MKLNLDMQWRDLRAAIKRASLFVHNPSKYVTASPDAVASNWAPAINDSDSIQAAWIPAGYVWPGMTATLAWTIQGTKAKLQLGDDSREVDCIDPSKSTTLQADHMLALFIQCMLFAFTCDPRLTG